MEYRPKVKDLILKFEDKSKTPPKQSSIPKANLASSTANSNNEIRKSEENLSLLSKKNNRLTDIKLQTLKHLEDDLMKLMLAKVDYNDTLNYIEAENELIFSYSELVDIESNGNKQIVEEKQRLNDLFKEFHFKITKPFMTSWKKNEANYRNEETSNVPNTQNDIGKLLVPDTVSNKAEEDNDERRKSVSDLKDLFERKTAEAVKPNFKVNQTIFLKDILYNEIHQLDNVSNISTAGGTDANMEDFDDGSTGKDDARSFTTEGSIMDYEKINENSVKTNEKDENITSSFNNDEIEHINRNNLNDESREGEVHKISTNGFIPDYIKFIKNAETTTKNMGNTSDLIEDGIEHVNSNNLNSEICEEEICDSCTEESIPDDNTPTTNGTSININDEIMINSLDNSDELIQDETVQ